MDRRKYLKSLLALGTFGTLSYSSYFWLERNSKVASQDFWKKKDLISELADIIIPETETPGAKSAKVEEYIINVLTECNTVRQQRTFYDGLLDVENYALKKFDQPFLKCTLETRIEVVEHFNQRGELPVKILNKINRKIFGEPFYSKLRDLTVEGYCQSLSGATLGLAYDYIPGSFEACIPMQKNQKSWATK